MVVVKVKKWERKNSWGKPVKKGNTSRSKNKYKIKMSRSNWKGPYVNSEHLKNVELLKKTYCFRDV
jgi:hypothetical protein